MAQLGLSTGEVDGGVNMPIQTARVIEKMHNPHRILSFIALDYEATS